MKRLFYALPQSREKSLDFVYALAERIDDSADRVAYLVEKFKIFKPIPELFQALFQRFDEIIVYRLEQSVNIFR